MSFSPEDPTTTSERSRILTAADGYAELGLSDMAWDELNTLSAEERSLPDVQELVLGLLVRQHRWAEVVETGRRLCAVVKDRPMPFIHTAYALHELGRTGEAKATLLAGPECLQTDPLFHYNMACYLAVGGELKDAEVALRTAFKLDAKLRVHARRDPDLKEIRGSF